MCEYKIGDIVSVWYGGINATVKKVIDDYILVLRMNETGDLLWAYIRPDSTLHFIYDDTEFNTRDLK